MEIVKHLMSQSMIIKLVSIPKKSGKRINIEEGIDGDKAVYLTEIA